MALHNENEQMKDHLDYVIKGGDPKKLERRMVDGLFNEADESQLFKTPQIDNQFDQYSEFQARSAGVKSFRFDGTDE